MLCGRRLLWFTRWTPFENSDKKFSFILWTDFWRNETILFWVYVYIRSFLHQIIMTVWFFKRRRKAGSQSYPEFTEWTNNVSPLSKKSYACCHLNWQRAYFLQQNVPWQPLNQWRQLSGSLLNKRKFHTYSNTCLLCSFSWTPYLPSGKIPPWIPRGDPLVLHTVGCFLLLYSEPLNRQNWK